MAGGKSEKDSEEKRFNDTLKRMLGTPPKPNKATSKPTRKSVVRKKTARKMKTR